MLPRPFWGLWRRNALEIPGAAHDRTTRVFYCQTPRLFIDVRVPAARPVMVKRNALADLARPERRALARQVGFAGYTEKRGDRLIWHHRFDYQLLPDPAAVADEGRIALNGCRMTEWGVHRPYTEQWERIDDGGGLFVGLEAEAGEPQAYLTVIGDHFMFARERAFRPRGAAGLGDALDTATPEAAAALLDCEFSYGSRRGGRMPWQVALSTLPMREGKRRFAANAWRIGAGGSRVVGPFGDEGRVRRWRIVDSTVPPERLSTVLNAR